MKKKKKKKKFFLFNKKIKKRNAKRKKPKKKKKKNILCSIATANASFTLGFTLLKNSKTKTLLKGFQLTNPGEIDLFVQHDKETNENKIIINKIELHSIFDEIRLQVPHYFNEFNETDIK
ncbi:hypothetical protein [Peptoniphilus vaginalis]|uniref:hypothetical protein n=1 Tax=Peptoniphilus vaginalis TaxID=1756987 RepID=UPI0023FA13BD|nr:hypothetical protein [Peptoniphilus vaginalis]